MATPREWGDAFLAQARADLAGARAVAAAGTAPSVLAMLLQMAFEKFAKAALLRAGQLDARARTHRAASRMVQVMRRQRGLMDPLGGPWPWIEVLDLVSALERAHPALVLEGQACIEYPWEDLHGAVRWPARDLAIAIDLGNPASNLGNRALNFARLLEQRFDEIFP